MDGGQQAVSSSWIYSIMTDVWDFAHPQWQMPQSGAPMPPYLAWVMQPWLQAHGCLLWGVLNFCLIRLKTPLSGSSALWQCSSWIQLNTCLHEHNGSQKKNNQKVGNLIPGQYIAQLGMLGASSHHERQSPEHFFILFDKILTRNHQWVSKQASQEASTPPVNQCPPRIATYHICVKQNIYFLDADWFQQVVGCWWPLESWY